MDKLKDVVAMQEISSEEKYGVVGGGGLIEPVIKGIIVFGGLAAALDYGDQFVSGFKEGYNEVRAK